MVNRYIKDMEALDSKKPNLYPLYLGHIVQFVKD